MQAQNKKREITVPFILEPLLPFGFVVTATQNVAFHNPNGDKFEEADSCNCYSKRSLSQQ